MRLAGRPSPATVAGMAGPLSGLKIVEMAGLGPGPFAAMMLADHGAEVIRVERAGMIAVPNDPLLRSRRSVSLDLKQDAASQVVRRLAASADGLIEGYRPGVMERLGLGPDELLQANPRLVYGRVTGWGQEGPLAQEAGHDVNYIAITGLLHGIGPKERPMVPINYLGDYAGGGLMLAFAMVAALLAVQRGGKGQVIDAAMSDGTALIGALTYGIRAAGAWRDEREANLLDGGEPYYGIYRCADGKGIKTIARREGNGWKLSGSKTYITNGPIADVILTFVTTTASSGERGYALLLIDGDSKGLTRGRIKCVDYS